jgi:hypothetical protein
MPGNSGNVLPELTQEQRRKGGLARAEQRRKQLQEQNERAEEAFIQVLREQAAPIAAALVEEILDNPLGHANVSEWPPSRPWKVRSQFSPATASTATGTSFSSAISTTRTWRNCSWSASEGRSSSLAIVAKRRGPGWGERRCGLEAVLDAKLEALADALIAACPI